MAVSVAISECPAWQRQQGVGRDAYSSSACRDVKRLLIVASAGVPPSSMSLSVLQLQQMWPAIFVYSGIWSDGGSGGVIVAMRLSTARKGVGLPPQRRELILVSPM